MLEKEKVGFARDGQRLVYVLFSPEDFFSLWGGGLNDYKDFLLAREERISCWEKRGYLDFEPVPFNRKDYAAWLHSDPSRKNLADPIGQWALTVAQNPEKLSSLRARHSFPPSIPPDEQLIVEVEAWIFPVEAEDRAALQGLDRPLPYRCLEELAGKFLALAKESNSPFERLSRRRALGVAVVPFDRFADPAGLFKLKKKFTRLFFRGDIGELLGCFPLPERHLLRPRLVWSYPRRVVLCLPFLVAGSKVEVSFFKLESRFFDLTSERAWRECLLFSGLGKRAKGGLFTSAALAESTAKELSVDL